MKQNGLNILPHLLMVFLLAAASAGAAPLHMTDFACGIRLDPPESGAVYRFYLPEAVYRRVTRQDLGDIRVFNARGEIVPHALRRPVANDSETRAPRSLPFFAVDRPAGDPETGVSLDITTDSKGTILSARSRSVTEAGTGARTYIIDAGGLNHRPDRIRLDWRGPGGSFVAEVRLASSHDLDHWRTLVPAATLAALQYGGHALRRDTISLPETPGKYLSIQWPEHARETILTRVEALFPKTVKAVTRRYGRAAFTAVADEPNSYTADVGGFFPVDRLNVVMNEPNSMATGRLYSRRDSQDRWQRRFEGLFYDLRFDDARLTNEDAAIAPVSDRWWRLEVVSDDGGMGGLPPALSAGWIPLELLFLARGGGPFTLAYGHAAVEPFDQNRHPLLHLLSLDEHERLIRWVEPGDAFSLRGDSALIPPKAPIPWKTWVLWSVLGIFVVLLAVMAFRLYRQMNPPPSP